MIGTLIRDFTVCGGASNDIPIISDSSRDVS